MISGPFVLRKTKEAQSAPVQVQPARPVATVNVEGRDSNVLGAVLYFLYFLMGLLIAIPYVVGVMHMIDVAGDLPHALAWWFMFFVLPFAILNVRRHD